MQTQVRLATNDDTTTAGKIPFGAMKAPEADVQKPKSQGAKRSSKKTSTQESSKAEADGQQAPAADNPRREGRRRRRQKPADASRKKTAEDQANGPAQAAQGAGSTDAQTENTPRRRRRRGRPRSKRGDRNRNTDANREQRSGAQETEGQSNAQGSAPDKTRKTVEPKVATGLFVAEKGGFGSLRSAERQYIGHKRDVFVPPRLIQRHKLREGSIIEGPVSQGKRDKRQLEDVTLVDGKPPKEWGNLRAFKSLTTIDPDFHYAVGDVTGEVSMRILDLIAPIGRGQRGLIVAQPRTGKTTLMRQFAKGIELGFPEVHLMVLLIDERPEEATEWVRSTPGQVFVSTSDETPKNHVQLAEAVWKRCQRLVEMGEDVVLILDSVTRLARAYNNASGGSGRTMSGGLDSRAMERPRQIFGSARNTETAGSLTILGTALIDTGSRMDQLIFEEFKGTGNMEVMLNRKLADRRIFPAIDIEKSGTRKEEKLVSSRRLKRINTLRRVLLRMNFIEAMELLSEKLLDVEKTDDFLQRFDVDPEA